MIKYIFSWALWLLLITMCLSKFYCHQDWDYYRSLPKGGGAYHLPLNGTAQFDNTFVLLHDMFWGASENQRYEGNLPIVIFPTDHFPATVPGVPHIFWPVVVLGFVGATVSFITLKPEHICVALVWLSLFFICSVVLSFHGRRLAVVLPFFCISAAYGYKFFEKKFTE